MIRGGIADKLGNRYEAKWLVRKLLDVIAGKAEWLVFEGVETEYQGFEFALGRGELNEWHQTKENSSGGNWTINALKREGVLSAFSNRLSADATARCFFVSQDNAKDFRVLTKKARIANSFDQFFNVLSKTQNDHFLQLKEAWKETNETIFNWLVRSYVQIIPGKELESIIESFGDLFFYKGGKNTFPVLRDILEKHFNKDITVETIRNAVKQQEGLTFKEWAFDSAIPQKLKEETQAYLDTYTPFGAAGKIIPRKQASTLLDKLCNPDGPEVILMKGVAGSGKSGVIRCAIEELRGLDIPHLAFRVDHYLSCAAREELGKRLTGREESPVSTLKGTFPEKFSVLFIDQVDAVSEVSGRDGQVKEVIFRMITDAHNFGGVKIVAACRAFDLDTDPRLKSLAQDNKTEQIEVPLLNWKTDVAPLFKRINVNSDFLNEYQRDLLCLPVNLAVFMEINEPDFLFRSRSNLHEKLIEKKQREISIKYKPSWSLIPALSAMCNWMSQRQKLNAPVSVLDGFLNAADILTAEGLITRSRGQINFFHESFFDHVYARTFVNCDQSLVDLLTSTEQHLFRRTQVRQILEALRQNDFDRYLKELSSILTGEDIRFHIKTAVCQWMSSIENPEEQEFKIISQFDGKDKYYQFFSSAVLSTHMWFDLLNESHWVQQEMGAGENEKIERMLSWFSRISDKRPVEISGFMRSWWGNDSERAERLMSWFGLLHRGKSDEELLKLFDDVINSIPNSFFQKIEQSHLMMLLNEWIEKIPARCGRILQSLYDVWFDLNPGQNPFENDGAKAIGASSLAEFAEKSSQAFLQGTSDAFVRSVDMVIAEGLNGINWYNFSHRTYSGQRLDFDMFLGMYRSSLKKMAIDSPEVTASYLKKLDPYKHESLMHLHLEIIIANPKFFGNSLPSLATNKMVFEAGWDGAKWKSFADACRAAFPYLSPGKKDIIEQAILDYFPEINLASEIYRQIKQEGRAEPFWTKKNVIYELNRSGYEQWCIFETISEALLSQKALPYLHQLRHKFSKKNVEKPNRIKGGRVVSPIKQNQCDKMNDRHWLSALKRYDNNTERYHGYDFVTGGARELARQLQEATKKDPTRFSALCLKIPDTAHHSYIEHILWGLSETTSPSDDLLIQVIKHAHRHPDKPFGRDIARLLEKKSVISTNIEILEILIWYALYGEADESKDTDIKCTEKETINVETLFQIGRHVQFRGINGDRGRAWEALASVLWEVPEAEDKIWEAVENASLNEKLISVRCCMMAPLVPLFNMNKKRFTNVIQKLIVLPEGSHFQHDPIRLSPLITYKGSQLFPYIFYWLPELGDKLCTELLECGDRAKELIGAWFAFGESFRNKAYIEKADRLASVSVDHRRLLARVSAYAIEDTEYRHRAESLLIKFFFDEDKEVRTYAARAFRNIKPDEVNRNKNLISEFLKSPAFSDGGVGFLHMLKESTCNVLNLVIEASQKIISEVAKHGFQKDRHLNTALHQIQKLLKKEYISSESNPEARKKILDLIDFMLEHEIFGADSIVNLDDRW